MSRICLLAPVWPTYQWLAPILAQQLKRRWKDHPPIHFTGMTRQESGELPCFPLTDTGLRKSWCGMLKEGVEAARSAGYTECYLILEEHLPLATCNSDFLNDALPRFMRMRRGVYASLMGWDNRRYLRRGSFMEPRSSGWLWLNTEEAPRFHLHPAWWNLEALELCLSATLNTGQSSAWAFEKTCEKWDAPLPEAFKRGCYQVEGNAHALHPLRGLAKLGRSFGLGLFHTLMGLYPLAARLGWGNRFWALCRFDDFFFNGPYPMFFSGVMAKGKSNPLALRFLLKRSELQPLATLIQAADQA